jgi:predicted short-subunit dehydrogenase-like oxidoreductase (DUF2520 family)
MAESSLKYEIVIVGSGNIAFALAAAFDKENHHLKAIYSRNEETGSKLALNYKCDFFQDITVPIVHCDFVFLCVPDNAIKKVAQQINPSEESIIVHTSGASSINELSDFKTFGVFYPLQSFSYHYPVNLFKCPVLIEGMNSLAETKLTNLANTISNNVQIVHSEKRLKYHLAAVVANNFTNFLLIQAEQYCKEEHLDFSILHSLILDGTKKSIAINPSNAQTGPAVRNDNQTIEKHLQILEKHPELKEIYVFLTGQIKRI